MINVIVDPVSTQVLKSLTNLIYASKFLDSRDDQVKSTPTRLTLYPNGLSYITMAMVTVYNNCGEDGGC